jgi:hypothetical protein
MRWTSICIAGLVCASVIVVWRIEDRTRIKPKSDCPILAWVLPIDHKETSPDDYIEMNSDGGGVAGPFVAIHVRIYGSGLVERETAETIRGDSFGCPLRESDKTIHIPPVAAKELLARARDGGFCRLCGVYQSPGIVFDAGNESLKLSLHGKIKFVWDHAGNPPPIFGELADSIWKLSDIEKVADPRRFSPDRTAECKRIEDARIYR